MKKTRTEPTAFDTIFEILSHLYPMCFSSINYSKPKARLRKCRFQISL